MIFINFPPPVAPGINKHPTSAASDAHAQGFVGLAAISTMSQAIPAISKNTSIASPVGSVYLTGLLPA